MKNQSAVEHSSVENSHDQQSSAGGSYFGSNAAQDQSLQQCGTSLADIFDCIASGHIQEAKYSAHYLAEQARRHQDNQTTQWAGKIWTVANAFSDIQSAISQEVMDGVKEKASLIGQLTRELMGSGHIAKETGDRILNSAGGYWNVADKESKSNKGQKENTGNANGAAAVAMNSETVEQYKMPTGKTGAHCGIATTLMLLQANGQGDMGDANQLVSEMYISGAGTDVDLMARSLRKRGLETAQATRTGTFGQLMDTLSTGQPVPFGIAFSTGEVVKMNKTFSSYYAHYQPGDRHYRKFGSAGHWVLVVGFEGNVDNPTHFIFNDPDVGGQLRATRAELEQMGVGNGQFYQVTQ